jgi:small multidrug resistance pump
MTGKLISIFFCFTYAALNVSGAAIIKNQVKGQNLDSIEMWIKFLLKPSVILAFSIIFLSALVMFKALSSGQFSFIVPISTGINFILTVMVGNFLFNDSLNFASLMGLVFIVTGILILALYSQSNG